VSILILTGLCGVDSEYLVHTFILSVLYTTVKIDMCVQDRILIVIQIITHLSRYNTARLTMSILYTPLFSVCCTLQSVSCKTQEMCVQDTICVQDTSCILH